MYYHHSALERHGNQRKIHASDKMPPSSARNTPHTIINGIREFGGILETPSGHGPHHHLDPAGEHACTFHRTGLR